MTQILPAGREVHYRCCNGISSNSAIPFRSYLCQVWWSGIVYCAVLVCLLFQYNSDDCIWLLVATVCSNESTLSLQPRAPRLQMIVGKVGRTPARQSSGSAQYSTALQYPKHPDCASVADNELLYLLIVIFQCFTLLDRDSRHIICYYHTIKNRLNKFISN